MKNKIHIVGAVISFLLLATIFKTFIVNPSEVSVVGVILLAAPLYFFLECLVTLIVTYQERNFKPEELSDPLIGRDAMGIKDFELIGGVYEGRAEVNGAPWAAYHTPYKLVCGQVATVVAREASVLKLECRADTLSAIE